MTVPRFIAKQVGYFPVRFRVWDTLLHKKASKPYVKRHTANKRADALNTRYNRTRDAYLRAKHGELE